MPEASEILEELRGVREQLRDISEQLRLLLIYEVDPGAAALPEGAVESRSRLRADDAFVQEHRETVAGGAGTRGR
jgi:hypothetical protein